MDSSNKVINAVSSATIDLTYLTEICGGDQDFMKSIISSFVNDVPEIIDRLITHCAKSDWWEVGQAAHQLKPSLQFVGLHQTLDCTKTIEYCCKQTTELTSVPALVDLVVQDIQAGIAELKTMYSL